MVDDELNILAVIDWESAGTAPRRLFTPPSWLAGRESPCVTGPEYRAEYAQFRAILESKREASAGHARLAEEWDAELPSRVIPLVELLRHHSQLIAIFYRALYPALFDAPKQEVVPEFFQRPEHHGLAQEAKQNLAASEQYTQYLKDNGLFVADPVVGNAPKLAESMRRLQQRSNSSM